LWVAYWVLRMRINSEAGGVSSCVR
jgi:hypothetical protein